MNRSTVIEIFYFDAGGGHRSAMNALSEVLLEQHPDWVIKPTNLQTLLEPIDPIYRLTDKLSVIREVIDEVKPKLAPVLQKFLEVLAPKLTFKILQSDQFYNEMLKRDKTRGLDILLPMLQRLIRLASPKIQKILLRHWQEPDNKPDMVISVIPNFNAVLFRALKKQFPDTPYVTIMTDMVDIPPHFWMEKQDQILICGTITAYQQALQSGFYDTDKIRLVSGMILKKCFYGPQPSPTSLRKKFGLSTSASVKTALVMFGGNGSATSEKIVELLKDSDVKIQTIVMCGHNKALYDRLKTTDHCFPVPFVSDITPYMRCADFLIGKPGPGSVSEAVHMGCPVIVESNSTTMPQERPNIAWIEEHDVGIAIKSFETDLIGAVEKLTRNLDHYRHAIGAVNKNRAVFEIGAILEEVLENPDAPSFETKTETVRKKTRSLRQSLTTRSLRWKKAFRTKRKSLRKQA